MTQFSFDAVMDRAHSLEITLKTIFTFTHSQSSVCVYYLGIYMYINICPDNTLPYTSLKYKKSIKVLSTDSNT